MSLFLPAELKDEFIKEGMLYSKLCPIREFIYFINGPWSCDREKV